MNEVEYPSLGLFVRDFVAQYLTRQVTDTHTAAWCPRWWRHPEGLLRLGLMWEGYCSAVTAEGTAGLSKWLLTCADPHMRVLLNPDGPFKYCSARHGHKDLLQVLPMDELPADLLVPIQVPISSTVVRATA